MMEDNNGNIHAEHSDFNRFYSEEQRFQDEKLEAMGELAGGIAHFFKNQLFGIGANAHIIKKHYPDNRFIVERSENIINAAQHCSDYIIKLLSFAQRRELKATPVDLHEIVLETERYLNTILDKKIHIQTHLNARYSLIAGDFIELKNAFINLALNAQDAMPEGGDLFFQTDDTSIESKEDDSNTSPLPPGEYCIVSVKDSGNGMSKDSIQHAFEPFYTTKKGTGKGLGLSEVYGIIKAHNGATAIFSQIGAGTEITMYLPHIKEEKETKEEVSAQSDDLAHPPERTIHQVLLIDDEEVVRLTAKEILADENITTTLFDSGKKALQYYREHWKEIDLVLLDIKMPEMSGEEIFYELRKINEEVKVILFSAFSDTGKVDGLLRNGALGFIEKPGAFSDLYSQIMKIILHLR